MTRSNLKPLAVLVAALLALGVLTVATSGIGTADQNDPSSRSAGKLGTLAWYTWFQDLGLQVHRVSGSFDVSGTDLLIVYDPTVAFTAAEAQSVRGLLRGGGEVVVVTDAATIAAAEPLLQALDAQPSRAIEGGVATPAQLFDSTGRVRSVRIGAGYSFAPEGALVPLLTVNGDTAAGALRVASGGRAYVVGSSLPFSNDGLRHDDSAYLALSLLQRARGGRIAFDEFHHGEGAQTASGAAAIFDGPIGVAAVLLAVLTLAALALNGRRLGKPVGVGDSSAVPSASGYVTALGHLFARTRQRGAIAARYADELKRRIGTVTGIDPHTDDTTFVTAVRGAGDAEHADALQTLLERLRRLQASDPDERDLLRAARDVDDIEHEWGQGAQLRP